MTDIELQIKQLEIKKAELEKTKKEEGLIIWKNQVKSTIGKVYKSVSTAGYNNRINTNYIQYYKVYGIKEIKEVDNAYLGVHTMRIGCTPVGWTRKEGVLKYKVGINSLTKSIKPDKAYENGIVTGKVYDYDWLKIVGFCNGLPNANYLGGTFEECTLQEFNQVEEKLGKLSKEFYDEMIPYVNSKYKFTEETEGMLSDIDEATIKRIDDVLKDSNVDLKKLALLHSGKIAKWNYFNGTTLPELAQYNKFGDKGLGLDIQSGDDGTDYEPYTTRYYIQSVSVDWNHILYPIRTKLKSVLETSKQLEKCKAIYNINNWECNFNTSFYDAYFENAKLNNTTLQKVNEIIKNNLL